MPTPTQTLNLDVFSIESNSTITGLRFDSQTQELSFNVTGLSGTMGCTNLTIAKSFLANIDNLKVHLDGNIIEYTVTSNDSAWMLTLTYHHSTHQIKISFSNSEPALFNFTMAGLILTVTLVTALVVLLGVIVYRRSHQKQKD